METIKSSGSFEKIGHAIDQRPWLKMLLIALLALHAVGIAYSAGESFIRGFMDEASDAASP